MKYRTDVTRKIPSRFISEVYFPAIVELSSEELNNRFIVFHFEDTDLMELTVHRDTNELKRLSLTLCKHYEIVDEELSVPSCEEGTFFIDESDSSKCSFFLSKVFLDGLQIIISDSPTDHFFKTGQLFFGLSADDELTNILITDLSPQEVDHIKTEFSF